MDASFLITLCEYLKEESQGEWVVPRKTFLFYQKPLSVWAEDLLTWVHKWGKSNSIESLRGIVSGDDSKGEPFFGVPEEVILPALRIVESRKKCEIFQDAGSVGVKFF